jgi:hypothetical protein
LFFDGISEALFSEIPESSVVKCGVLLYIERFEIGQSYVTAKVQNRYGDKVTISLFKIKDQDRGGSPRYAYLLTKPIQMVRKLPVIGLRDWLLIYEDTLLEPSVKDEYDELEIVVV